ncbi:MAG: GntR family transcriptional regulator [Methylomonas sp.]|nr:GntR family transcriptional regulator [Methylomonas sp.]PPD22341.1 MAG: GntR family transcriptional regulator [Methylomonas sp.]PPD24106.1 MAG: GntR family transcriptional regulator [Methylomonas sp.]PPD32684.1 MAG: GntR family transcriptional regulator [Methylomonas sp.]PPD40205.1 MAG: GntR family transcriptional regulator [Methylomonas sp.]
MIELGKINSLSIKAHRDGVCYLDGEDHGEIPLDEADTNNLAIGGRVDVFVYIDGKSRLIATRQHPKAQVNEVAWLKCVSLSHAGAFLDWGLPKDLLLPFSEHKGKVVEGRSYLVRLFLDEDNRIAASMRLDEFIQDQAFYYKDGQAVGLIVAEHTDLGFKVIVDHKYWGVLYKNEVFQPLKRGQSLDGLIKKLRPDHKLDVMLVQGRYGDKVDSTSDKILSLLEARGGFLALTDKSDPQVIYDTFGVSKKVFKQAMGGLYKARKITIDDIGLHSVEAE